jgi:hypothetical protein
LIGAGLSSADAAAIVPSNQPTAITLDKAREIRMV